MTTEAGVCSNKQVYSLQIGSCCFFAAEIRNSHTPKKRFRLIKRVMEIVKSTVASPPGVACWRHFWNEDTFGRKRRTTQGKGGGGGGGGGGFGQRRDNSSTWANSKLL